MSFAPKPDENGVRWYGTNMERRREDAARCIETVSSGESRWKSFHQCSRKRGHGPDGLYCKQHNPEVVAARREAERARWERKRVAEREAREAPKRADFLAGVRAGLEAAAALVCALREDRYPEGAVGRSYGVEAQIECDIRALSAEAIAKEASDAAE